MSAADRQHDGGGVLLLIQFLDYQLQSLVCTAVLEASQNVTMTRAEPTLQDVASSGGMLRLPDQMQAGSSAFTHAACSRSCCCMLQAHRLIDVGLN